uniref:Uncharacterized protein n=1 Tax=Arundo donax TaxID=35708 RepID=A0A0A9CXT0_ARUDO
MTVVQVQTQGDLHCCLLVVFVDDQKHQKMPSHHRSLMEHFSLVQEQAVVPLH